MWCVGVGRTVAIGKVTKLIEGVMDEKEIADGVAAIAIAGAQSLQANAAAAAAAAAAA